MKIRHAGMVSLCCLPLLAAHGREVLDDSATRAICSRESASQVDMHDCLQKKSRDSEAALLSAERKVQAALAKWDEDVRFRDVARANLSASRRAFLKYRNAQCTFRTALGGGAIGNGLDMLRYVCIYEMDMRRARQLQEAVAVLPMK